MLVKFLAKRVVVLAAMGAAAAFVLRGYRFDTSLGILLGAAVGLYRLRFNSRVLAQATTSKKPKTSSVLYQLLSQILVFGLLLATIIASIYLFIGFAAGLLSIPLVICVNAFSEKLGITRNGWGENSF